MMTKTVCRPISTTSDDRTLDSIPLLATTFRPNIKFSDVLANLYLLRSNLADVDFPNDTVRVLMWIMCIQSISSQTTQL